MGKGPLPVSQCLPAPGRAGELRGWNSLDYAVSSKLAWATQQEPIQKPKQTKRKPRTI